MNESDLSLLKSATIGTRIVAVLPSCGATSYIKSSFGRFSFWVNLETGEALTATQMAERFDLLCRRGGTVTIQIAEGF